MNGILFQGVGRIQQGVECYVFTEMYMELTGSRYALNLNRLFTREIAEDCIKNQRTLFVEGTVTHGPSICMEGQGLLSIFDWSEVSKTEAASFDLPEKQHEHFKIQMESLAAGSANLADCDRAKVIAFLDLQKGVGRRLTQLLGMGYHYESVKCERRICLFSSRCYLVTFTLRCPDEIICIVAPTVWALVDLTRGRVRHSGEGGVPSEISHFTHPQTDAGFSTQEGCGCESGEGAELAGTRDYRCIRHSDGKCINVKAQNDVLAAIRCQGAFPAQSHSVQRGRC